MSGVEQRFRGPSFLQGALDRFSSPELRDFIRRRKINLEEVESLKRTSAKIHYLSDDAEVKQFTNDAVKLWLNHLKQLFYDAEDILDDYATEILRLKLESNSHHQTQQQSDGTESADKDINETSEGIDQPKVFNMAEELQGIKRFGSKVRDIHEKLKSVEQEGAALGLMNSSIGSGSSRPSSERPQTSSLVNSTNVFGRDEDKWEIVKWLLSANDYDNSFSVLPIVGMGGLGKTTLAQLVYNDEKVDKYFQLKAWVCISEDFDVMRLTKEIHDSATKSSSPPSDSLDVLQVNQEARYWSRLGAKALHRWCALQRMKLLCRLLEPLSKCRGSQAGFWTLQDNSTSKIKLNPDQNKSPLFRKWETVISQVFNLSPLADILLPCPFRRPFFPPTLDPELSNARKTVPREGRGRVIQGFSNP